MSSSIAFLFISSIFLASLRLLANTFLLLFCQALNSNNFGSRRLVLTWSEHAEVALPGDAVSEGAQDERWATQPSRVAAVSRPLRQGPVRRSLWPDAQLHVHHSWRSGQRLAANKTPSVTQTPAKIAHQDVEGSRAHLEQFGWHAENWRRHSFWLAGEQRCWILLSLSSWSVSSWRGSTTCVLPLREFPRDD